MIRFIAVSSPVFSQGMTEFGDDRNEAPYPSSPASLRRMTKVEVTYPLFASAAWAAAKRAIGTR
jgi:hypothetical protein